jgi:cAMP-dependent protein kinase regulator
MLEEGDAFGEVALLYDAVRTATITSITDGVLWKLDGIIFKNIIIESTQKRRSTELGFLQGIDLFRNLDKYEKLKLLDGLKVLWFKKGDAIIRAGERGQMFYIIEEGHVECL